MLELQVALILMAFGMVTLSGLMMTQTRVMNRVRGNFRSGTTLYLTQSPDPWVQQLQMPALVSNAEQTLTTPSPTSNPEYSLGIVTQQNGLTDESISVTVDLTQAD